MPRTLIAVPDQLMNNLRSLLRDRNDPEEQTALTEAVRELLELAPDDNPNHDTEYAFLCTLRGMIRVTDRSKVGALLALTEYQAVDCNVPYENATLTEVSFVPEDVDLVEIDGNPIDGR